MPPRRLSDRERAEWLDFAQSLGVKPRMPPPPPPSGPGPRPDALAVAVPAAKAILPAPPAAGRPRARPEPAPLTVGGAAAGLDQASWERLRRGRLRPQRVLDLHGRTAQSAFSAFQGFIAAARADGIRCVEIVTGRGAGEGGVLRRELPLWINLPQLRGAILAATHPHRANPGAVVLLLRRLR